MTTERQWKPIRTYQDILFYFYEGIARITIMATDITII